MEITGFDHIVLTVSDVQATLRFYSEVLGMTPVLSGRRHELCFGSQKINIHTRKGEFLPAAQHPAPGSADFCLVAHGPMEALVNQVQRLVPIELGPVQREGACGPMSSIYLRDPDNNLVEICVYE